MPAGSRPLFPLEEKAEKFTHYVFNRLVKEKKIDLVRKIRSEAKDRETLDLSTLKNEDVRELGTDRMSLQAFICELTGYPVKKITKDKLYGISKKMYVEGFIKYSTVFEGNIADCQILGSIVENLRQNISSSEKKAVVVIDAGIATKENLELLKSKGYDYVCVSRSNLTKYKVSKESAMQDKFCQRFDEGMRGKERYERNLHRNNVAVAVRRCG